MKFQSLYEFTPLGIKMFEKVFTGELDETAINLTDTRFATQVEGAGALSVVTFTSAKHMAQTVIDSLQDRSVYELLPSTGLWAWLTFVLRDQLFLRDAQGKRKVGEIHRWYPSNPNDWRKGQRHIVRMPVLLLASLKENADHLLCGPPSVLPEIREQLTSQQDMFNPEFQRIARALYYDNQTNSLKPGAGGKGKGSPRRLAKVRQQLDVTWDLNDLEFDRIMAKLPKEFDRFKPSIPTIDR